MCLMYRPYWKSPRRHYLLSLMKQLQSWRFLRRHLTWLYIEANNRPRGNQPVAGRLQPEDLAAPSLHAVQEWPGPREGRLSGFLQAPSKQNEALGKAALPP